MIQEIFEDFCSVEQIPGQPFSVAFIPDLRRTFREEAEPAESVTTDGKRYVPWGNDNQMPYDIISMIEADETMATCQLWNAEMCYGSGLKYNCDNASSSVKEQVKEFFATCQMAEYFLGVAQDMKHFNFCVSAIILDREGKKIVAIQRKEACYCRFSKADSFGRIKSVIYGNFRESGAATEFEEIPLLDTINPLLDLKKRMGLEADEFGKFRKSEQRVYAVLSKFPGIDSLYYPIPHYASLFRGSYYSIKRLIGIAKEAKLKNAAPIKYLISVSQKYWDDIFASQNVTSKEGRKNLVRERKQQMMRFLTDTANTGSVLFTGKGMNFDGKSESPYISITPIDSKTVEGGDWASDIAEAINMICFTMHVHSNLVGSVPGKSQTNNSGSDKRELYTIAQALQKPYHDILFTVHRIIIDINGWKGVEAECPFIKLTTLDEHTDAKQVKVG